MSIHTLPRKPLPRSYFNVIFLFRLPAAFISEGKFSLRDQSECSTPTSRIICVIISIQVPSHAHLVNVTDLGRDKLGLIDDSIRPLQLDQLSLRRGPQLDAVSALETQGKRSDLKKCLQITAQVAT